MRCVVQDSWSVQWGLPQRQLPQWRLLAELVLPAAMEASRHGPDRPIPCSMLRRLAPRVEEPGRQRTLAAAVGTAAVGPASQADLLPLAAPCRPPFTRAGNLRGFPASAALHEAQKNCLQADSLGDLSTSEHTHAHAAALMSLARSDIPEPVTAARRGGLHSRESSCVHGQATPPFLRA